MLRSILVALDGSPYSETAIVFALDWATRLGARVVGLGVLDAPSIARGEPVPMGVFAYKKERDEARLADAHRRVLGFLAPSPCSSPHEDPPGMNPVSSRGAAG